MLANWTSQLLQQNNVLMPSEKPVTARSPETKGSTERKTVKSTTKPDLEVIEVDFVEPTSQGNTNECLCVQVLHVYIGFSKVSPQKNRLLATSHLTRMLTYYY